MNIFEFFWVFISPAEKWPVMTGDRLFRDRSWLMTDGFVTDIDQYNCRSWPVWPGSSTSFYKEITKNFFFWENIYTQKIITWGVLIQVYLKEILMLPRKWRTIFLMFLRKHHFYVSESFWLPQLVEFLNTINQKIALLIEWVNRISSNKSSIINFITKDLKISISQQYDFLGTIVNITLKKNLVLYFLKFALLPKNKNYKWFIFLKKKIYS